jgi:hypothetical protein
MPIGVHDARDPSSGIYNALQVCLFHMVLAPVGDVPEEVNFSHPI